MKLRTLKKKYARRLADQAKIQRRSRDVADRLQFVRYRQLIESRLKAYETRGLIVPMPWVFQPRAPRMVGRTSIGSE